MSMMVTNGLYNNYAANNADQLKKKEADTAKEVEAKKQGGEIKQPQLSKAAQNILDKLKKQYGDMDFMVADFSTSEEARKILSRGTKEYSVLFSSDELEKMASDASYEKECMERLQSAVDMSDEISQKFGLESDGENGEITKVGISFNKDGTTSFFAELEKSSSQQRERIEKNREKRAEEKKAAEKKDQTSLKNNNRPVQRTTVEASSQEELIKKLGEIDWSKIKREDKVPEGSRFDFTI